MKKYSLDLHDASILNTKLDLLLDLKEHLPKLKVTFGFIPWDVFRETSLGRINRDKELARLKENLDWIQLVPHGLSHIQEEFARCDRHTMKMVLESIDEVMKKDDLPYEKGFMPPYWLWNQEVVDILDENGWWGAVDRNQPTMLRTKKFYVYTHSIDEPFWKSDLETVKLHGHMGLPSHNNVEDCLLNLLKIDPQAEWQFVSEVVQ